MHDPVYWTFYKGEPGLKQWAIPPRRIPSPNPRVFFGTIWQIKQKCCIGFYLSCVVKHMCDYEIWSYDVRYRAVGDTDQFFSKLFSCDRMDTYFWWVRSKLLKKWNKIYLFITFSWYKAFRNINLYGKLWFLMHSAYIKFGCMIQAVNVRVFRKKKTRWELQIRFTAGPESFCTV